MSEFSAHHATGEALELMMSMPPRQSRPWHQSERSCSNCIHHRDCWETFTAQPVPTGWSLRTSWLNDPNKNFAAYMKTVYGGLCQQFQHPDRETNESLRLAEQRRIQELPVPEWES